MLCFLNGVKKALLIAIGGGGDIASTIVLARRLEKYGVETVLASIAWERYIYDPVPGPIRLSEFYNTIEANPHYVLITGESYAVRSNRKIIPQVVKASRFLGKPVYIVDLYNGVEGYYKALKSIMNRESIDIVIGVDVGGDVVATGFEDELWSPLADWMGLATVSRVNGVIAVHSPGSDGELPQKYIIERIDELSVKNGLLGVSSMCREDAELLSEVLKYVESEASRIPLLAYNGHRGSIEVRRGSRRADVTVFNTFTFYLDSQILVENTKPVKHILYTTSLDEARRLLNSMGIYTELDLEEDLAAMGVKPGELTGELLLKVREDGRKRIKKLIGNNNVLNTENTL